MASVDPDDDGIRRYVVYRYAYDPARRERRYQVVGAVDNKREWDRLFKETSAELERRRAAGENAEPTERITGMELEPGYHRRAQNARIVQRAYARGAGSDPRLAELELPRHWSFELELPRNMSLNGSIQALCRSVRTLYRSAWIS
jgi:hypothetical protein